MSIRYLALSLALVGVYGSTSAAELEEIVVVAHPLASGGLAQATTILDGEELDEAKAASIGETLVKQAGVNSASFGAAVGRPIIHGLGATRVKTTQDQIDTLDVSVTSGDHAATVEPFVADTISVLKGSSTLLYGSGAIGGVVDVDTGRHKTVMPESFSGRAEIRFADVDDSTTAALRLDGRLTDSLAWHVDAFSRDADDYEIPGFAESAVYMARENSLAHDDEHEESHEEGHEDEHADAELEGVLEGSRNKSEGGAFALSYIGERAHASASVSQTDSIYGLVGGHAHEHADEHHADEHDADGHQDGHSHDDEHHMVDGVGLIDLEQTRVDLRAGYLLENAWLQKIDVLFGRNDYEHAELEASGEVGTLFTNDAWEARVELHHQSVAQFKGLFGLQSTDRQFSASGEEAFIEPVDTQSNALFWLGERNIEAGTIEAGVRFESVDMTPKGIMPNRSFESGSASLGYVHNLNDTTTLSVLLDYSSRAPSIEELYSNGPHLATQTFDIGNVDLSEEKATSLSFTANWDWQAISATTTLYYNDFGDFIYQSATGDEDDELPVFVYQQDDARFYGIDFAATIDLGLFAGGELVGRVLLDSVNAKIHNGETNQNLPRIPSNRVGFGLSWKTDTWSVIGDFLHVDAQNKVADFELPTAGYQDLSLSVNRNLVLGTTDVQLFLKGKNLTNDEQRYHASFVKDFAPAPARSIEAGVRMEF